uniref:protein-tyrosine-phosphatase n=2 Tax=Schmidtea mediterranea TaxID=79327 RepID=A0A172RVS3_SCHMD|nr:CDC25-1 protein [Schmidtea mediterranea]
MNDKENGFKKSNKRKSLDDISYFIPKKPFNLIDSISEDQNHNISISLDSVSKDQNHNSSILDISDSSIAEDYIPLSSCLTGNFKVACEIQYSESLDISPCIGTPKAQIIPLKDFKNLPKPQIENYVISGKKIVSYTDNKFMLNKSFSDTNALNSSLNDSFGVLKHDLSKNNSYTPINLLNNLFNHNTPETPCDLYTMDIDSQKSIDCLPKMRQMISQKSGKFVSASIAASPMCPEIENEPTRRRRLLKSRIIQTDQIIDESCFKDENDIKITEVSADFVAKIIENDFTSDSYAYHIIDCRYPYEYDGGHLLGAVNLYTPWQLLNYIFLAQNDLEYLKQPVENTEDSMVDLINTIINIKKPNSSWKTEAFIFHCEFSSVRGPEM